MKREQNDIQDFSRLMKSVLQEKTDSITTLQDKLVEVRLLMMAILEATALQSCSHSWMYL